MGVLIPADFDLRILTNPAERRVVENLRDRLTHSWKIIPRLDVASAKRPHEVDVLIFHEKYGVIGIEVKGGQVTVKEGEWYVGKRRLDTPAPRQAQDACYALRDRVRQAHHCFEQFHVHHAVAMPDTDDTGIDLVPLQATRETLLFQEDLNHVGKRVIELLMTNQYVQYNVQREIPAMTPQQIEEFVKVVRPTIPYKRDPEAQARDARISLNAIMREQVRALSTLDMNNTVFVHGAAGTGKTQLALRWAERALANGERVLLTCYNIPLADYLATQFVDQPNIVVSNFVDMFGKIEGMPDLPVPEGADSDWYKNAPVAHIAAHAGQLVGKFDTIIVDEAQDFYGEWITSLLELHEPDGQQRLLMVGDSQQNLFERNAVDVMEEMGATQAELLLNCRNTHEIGALLQSMGGAQVANASPDGQGVFFTPVTSTEELVSAVALELEDLIGTRMIDPAHVLVVTVRTDDRDAIRNAMPGGYNCTSWEDREDDNVVCETVQRTKGLEYDAVILATTSTTVRDSLLYVGASRAVSLLTVIAPVEIGQKLGLTE